jgi:hypothetical protein
MDLILVIIIFIILICVIKTREYFYAQTAWSGHGHNHNDVHTTTPTHFHKTLPIANPNFKYKDRKMICELLEEKKCIHYGCEWDGAVCRNPTEGINAICEHVNDANDYNSNKKEICNALDDCIWNDYSVELEHKKKALVKAQTDLDTVNTNLTLAKKELSEAEDELPKATNNADENEKLEKMDQAAEKVKQLEIAVREAEKAEREADAEFTSEQERVNTNAQCKLAPYCGSINDICTPTNFVCIKQLCGYKSSCKVDTSGSPWNEKCIAIHEAGATSADKELNLECDKYTNFQKCRELTDCTLDHTVTKQVCNTDRCKMSTHKISEISDKPVCRPKIHTCEDLTDEDTCESYPNIRYCRWETPDQNCVERIRNTDDTDITLPTYLT